MNQKQRQSAQMASPKRWPWGWICLCLVLVGLVTAFILSGVEPLKPETANPRSAIITPSKPGEMVLEIQDKEGRLLISSPESEGVKLINDLLVAIRPELSENAFMPPYMKEKISWVYAEITAKRLELRPYAGYFQTPEGVINQATFMSTGYDTQKRISYIDISMARFLAYTKLQCNVPSGFNERVKVQFALMIVHEATHLEQSPEFFVGSKTKESGVAEEIRAWAKVNFEVVRGLREAGKPVESDLIEADDILKRCSDSTECSEFQAFVSARS